MPRPMGAAETLSGLAAFERRAGGSDTERRAAGWLRDELLSAGAHDPDFETFWCRPNSALAHAWHVGLGLAGSLLAVASARVGGILILIALVSIVADALLGVSLGRRLTPERASQNVLSPATTATRAIPAAPPAPAAPAAPATNGSPPPTRPAHHHRQLRRRSRRSRVPRRDRAARQPARAA